MTATADLNAARAHRSMQAAQELIDAGFCTKAAQKTAMEHLNRAYSSTREIVHGMAIDAARAAHPGCMEVTEGSDPLWQGYLAAIRTYDMPFDLHQVRPAHLAAIKDFAPGSEMIIRELVDMRAVAKATPVTPIVRDETKVRIETIRKSIVEEMERRRAQYVEALDIGRQFGGLPVSVNAHWVRHEQGTVFLRHYFYLRGVLTPLQVIMAAADTLEREAAEQGA